VCPVAVSSFNETICYCVVMQKTLSMNVMDTIMMVTNCVLSVPVVYRAAVVARIVAVVVAAAMVVVIIIRHVANNQGKVPPLADLTTESTCQVR